MDPHSMVHRDEFYNVQMDLRQVRAIQGDHGDRLLRLERRQQDDTAMKSVWNNSSFPPAISTPLHGPMDGFSLGEPGQLHGSESLQLEPDDEPIRRSAASRANSVRFDESANWAQSTRHSGDFGLTRPGSGLAMERSLSHKSDGRHSSTGHSVHSNHSMASGRGSSLVLETNLMFGGHEDRSPVDIPEPPPSLFILGPVPAIIRCWLTQDFRERTVPVLYAAICSGSQKSTLGLSLVEELGLLHDVYRDMDGVQRLRGTISLAEAMVSHTISRSPNPHPRFPAMHANFEIVEGDGSIETANGQKAIRIFIGSDTLRAHNADLLFSRNQMVFYGSDRDKFVVPFVRPEDDFVFKNLSTSHVVSEKPKLNASAAEFVSGESKASDNGDKETGEQTASQVLEGDAASQGLASPSTDGPIRHQSESGGESDAAPRNSTSSDHSAKEAVATPDGSRRDSSAIWGSWRAGSTGGDSLRGDNAPLSGYQPAGRPRAMKVLKAKTSAPSPSTRTGASYEPAPPSRSSGELRRKSQGTGPGAENGSASNSIRWESKRSLNTAAAGSGGMGRENKPQGLAMHDLRNVTAGAVPRSANPVGTASAFAWMNPAGKPKTATAE